MWISGRVQESRVLSFLVLHVCTKEVPIPSTEQGSYWCQVNVHSKMGLHKSHAGILFDIGVSQPYKIIFMLWHPVATLMVQLQLVARDVKKCFCPWLYKMQWILKDSLFSAFFFCSLLRCFPDPIHTDVGISRFTFIFHGVFPWAVCQPRAHFHLENITIVSRLVLLIFLILLMDNFLIELLTMRNLLCLLCGECSYWKWVSVTFPDKCLPY